MGQMVSDYVLERLTKWGIHRIFGYPGDGINGFLGALDRANGDPDFIQARHEEMAAFMAVGHAKFTSEIGCCIATSGPGAIHLLNGLYDAKMDHAPVLAIVGQQRRASIGAEYQQEVDLQDLFKDVSEFVSVCMEPEQARHLIDRGQDRARGAGRRHRDLPGGRAGGGGRGVPAPGAWIGVFLDRVVAPAHHSDRGRPPEGRRRLERRLEGGDADRPGGQGRGR